jgi:TolA-binding protein
MNFSSSRRNSWNALIGTVTVAVAIQGCTSPRSPVVELEQKTVPVVDGSVKVRELRKQIRERDKRIEELESQLEVLKLIDQDSKNQKTLLRPPTTLEPLE